MVRHPPRGAQDGPAGQDPPLTLDPALLSRLRSAEGERLLALAAAGDLTPAGRLTALGALRRAARDDALAAAAYETAVLRRHALAKHPQGDRLFWTREALEQSTAAPVAAHRAARYAVAGTVLDVCCSAGADLLALAGAGHQVVGVDVDPLRLALAAANADALGVADLVTLVRADAAALAVRPGAWVFCDPARRAGAKRVFDPRRYAPPPSP